MAHFGESSDFRTWLGENQAIVHKVARAFTRSKEDQEDLTQEILLRIWTSRNTFRAESRVSTWIYRIALNRALTWKRDTNSRPGVVPIDVAIPSQSSDRDCDRDDLLERLYDAIRALGEVDRALILLALDDCTYQEMADIMGMTANHVGVRLNRAKKQLGLMMRTEE